MTAVAAVLVALGSSACRVDVSVGLDSGADGTGRVRARATLDAEAVTELVGQAAGSPETVDPATRIKLDDLREAGWTIDGPSPTDGGGLEVVATHDYDDPQEARRLLAEVGGTEATSPFKAIDLRQERGFFRTTTRFRGTVDLDAGLGSFTDPELRRALEATPDAPIGITQEQLERRLGEAVDRMFGLQFAVRLPGRLQDANAPTRTDDGAVWAPRLGEEVTLEATSERWNVVNVVALAIALTTAAVLLAVLLRRRPVEPLTVTTGNVTLGNDGQAGTDGRGAGGS